jgi:hypothetical protein
MTDWEQNIPSKKTGCLCNVMIKCYLDTEIVLRHYENMHDHLIGIANAPFRRLTAKSWEQMREMVIQKIDLREIVHNHISFSHASLIKLHLKVCIIQESAPQHGRDQFIMLCDVSRMTCSVQEETICLHTEDGISTKLWVDRLKSMKVNVFYKDKFTPPPSASRLQGDTFILCMQTPFQMDMFRQLGNSGFTRIDATHNVTHFWDVLLFMIITRDQWGHGTYKISKV